MKFVKRLVILSGEGGKGTLNLERNAYGVFGRLSAFGGGSQPLDLVIRIDGGVFTRSVSAASGFKLEGVESVDVVQAAVFSGGRLLMYGTNESRRLSTSEAGRLLEHIKKEKQLVLKDKDALFSTGAFKREREIGLSCGENRGDTDSGIDLDVDIGWNYGAGRDAEGGKKPEDNYERDSHKADIYETDSHETVYEDERLAEENFYPDGIDYSKVAAAAEERAGNMKNFFEEETEQLSGYAVLPAALARAFLADRIAIKTAQESVRETISDAVQETMQETIQESVQETVQESVQKAIPAVVQKEPPPAAPPAHLSPYRQPARQNGKGLKLFGEDGKARFRAAEKSGGLQSGKNGLKGGREFFAFFGDDAQAEAAAALPESLTDANPADTLNGYPAADILKTADKAKTPHTPNAEPKAAVQRVSAFKSDPHVKARQGTFFERNSEEIERLFKGPREQALEKLLPDSRWVKINYDGSGRFYVIGLIGREFLCYGVPAEFSPAPPAELNGYCWWLPLIPDRPEGRGYWIMYQNLITGETVYPKQN